MSSTEMERRGRPITGCGSLRAASPSLLLRPRFPFASGRGRGQAPAGHLAAHGCRAAGWSLPPRASEKRGSAKFQRAHSADHAIAAEELLPAALDVAVHELGRVLFRHIRPHPSGFPLTGGGNPPL